MMKIHSFLKITPRHGLSLNFSYFIILCDLPSLDTLQFKMNVKRGESERLEGERKKQVSARNPQIKNLSSFYYYPQYPFLLLFTKYFFLHTKIIFSLFILIFL